MELVNIERSHWGTILDEHTPKKVQNACGQNENHIHIY